MKKKEWRFVFKAISAEWREVEGKKTSHRIDAVLVSTEYEHHKFTPGDKVVLHIHGEEWPEGLPRFAAGDRFVAISHRKPSVGAPGYKPSFTLSRNKSNQPRHVELMSILK